MRVEYYWYYWQPMNTSEIVAAPRLGARELPVW
jgi:hypothetical protein